MRSPTPSGFSTQSAESLEKKRVEFCTGAKKCRRVRKNLKRKKLNTVASDEWRLGKVRSEPVPEWGILGTHPGSFRKSGKQRGYGIRNLEEGYGRWETRGNTGGKEWESLLAFSELISFVRTILQGEENKGVEFTGCVGKF
jgi:hypothetical protein